LRSYNSFTILHRISEVAIVQVQPHVLLMWIAVQVVNALGVEARGAADDTMHLVALREEEFRQIGTVLGR